MFRAQTVQACDPLVHATATVGDVHADAQIGGSDGKVLDARIDHLAGLNADVEVDAGCNDSALAVDAGIGVGPHIDVDGSATVGEGIGVNADIDLDGALLNAAAGLDAMLDIDSVSLGDGGCTDTGSSTGSGDINIPDILSLGPVLSSIELPVIDLFCGDSA